MHVHVGECARALGEFLPQARSNRPSYVLLQRKHARVARQHTWALLCKPTPRWFRM